MQPKNTVKCHGWRVNIVQKTSVIIVSSAIVQYYLYHCCSGHLGLYDPLTSKCCVSMFRFSLFKSMTLLWNLLFGKWCFNHLVSHWPEWGITHEPVVCWHWRISLSSSTCLSCRNFPPCMLSIPSKSLCSAALYFPAQGSSALKAQPLSWPLLSHLSIFIHSKNTLLFMWCLPMLKDSPTVLCKGIKCSHFGGQKDEGMHMSAVNIRAHIVAVTSRANLWFSFGKHTQREATKPHETFLCCAKTDWVTKSLHVCCERADWQESPTVYSELLRAYNYIRLSAAIAVKHTRERQIRCAVGKFTMQAIFFL